MVMARYPVGMFVRINESGGRRYLQVVESYRNEAGKPRHRVIANLGRIDGMEDGHLDALIRGLCRAAGRDEPARLEITHAPARA
ncbi:IS1634 family transposase, partial [Rhodovulum sp. 12E13]